MDRALALAAVIAVVAVLTLWWRAQQGRIGSGGGQQGDELAAAVGATGRAALVEFTAPGCVACRSARVVLEHVAADRPDVVVATVDVTHAPALARTHRVLRAPTTLVLAPDGGVAGRIAGVPDAAAVDALLPPVVVARRQ